MEQTIYFLAIWLVGTTLHTVYEIVIRPRMAGLLRSEE